VAGHCCGIATPVLRRVEADRPHAVCEPDGGFMLRRNIKFSLQISTVS
jgi:hypothetical protein